MATWLEGLSRPRDIEVAQVLRRYPEATTTRKEDGSLEIVIKFESTDPDFKLQLLQGLSITITLPPDYPDSTPNFDVTDETASPLVRKKNKNIYVSILYIIDIMYFPLSMQKRNICNQVRTLVAKGLNQYACKTAGSCALR